MSTSQGHPHAIFQRAIRRRNVLSALAAAKQLPQLSLLDPRPYRAGRAQGPRRHQRIAARWFQRYLEEHPAATIEEATLAASSLVALTGASYQEATQTLRAMAERATRGLM